MDEGSDTQHYLVCSNNLGIQLNMLRSRCKILHISQTLSIRHMNPLFATRRGNKSTTTRQFASTIPTTASAKAPPVPSTQSANQQSSATNTNTNTKEQKSDADSYVQVPIGKNVRDKGLSGDSQFVPKTTGKFADGRSREVGDDHQAKD